MGDWDADGIKKWVAMVDDEAGRRLRELKRKIIDRPTYGFELDSVLADALVYSYLRDKLFLGSRESLVGALVDYRQQEHTVRQIAKPEAVDLDRCMDQWRRTVDGLIAEYSEVAL